MSRATIGHVVECCVLASVSLGAVTAVDAVTSAVLWSMLASAWKGSGSVRTEPRSSARVRRRHGGRVLVDFGLAAVGVGDGASRSRTWSPSSPWLALPGPSAARPASSASSRARTAFSTRSISPMAAVSAGLRPGLRQHRDARHRQVERRHAKRRFERSHAERRSREQALRRGCRRSPALSRSAASRAARSSGPTTPGVPSTPRRRWSRPAGACSRLAWHPWEGGG